MIDKGKIRKPVKELCEDVEGMFAVLDMRNACVTTERKCACELHTRIRETVARTDSRQVWTVSLMSCNLMLERL